jgi:hypothetical protein
MYGKLVRDAAARGIPGAVSIAPMAAGGGV